MFGLTYTGYGLNMGNMDYHKSVTERHTNLVLKFLYLNYMDYVEYLNIIGVDGKSKDNRQKRSRRHCSCYIQNYFLTNTQTMAFYFAVE